MTIELKVKYTLNDPDDHEIRYTNISSKKEMLLPVIWPILHGSSTVVWHYQIDYAFFEPIHHRLVW